MAEGARALELLALLQSRRSWQAADLAARLEVSVRTLRRDVSALQGLGYPIVSSRGTGGGYSLLGGSSLPPLVLTEDEAVALVLRLGEAGPQRGPLTGATEKLLAVLPPKLRRRADALRRVMAVTPDDVPDSAVDSQTITAVALAARDTETVSLEYHANDGSRTRREVQPHDLVLNRGRVYLIGYDLLRQDWRLLRLDRVRDVARTGRTFARRSLPGGDPLSFLAGRLRAARTRYVVRATVHTSAADAAEVLAGYATIRMLTPDSCEVLMAADQLEWVAFGLGSLGVHFEVHEPPAVRDYLRGFGQRMLNATSGE